MKKNNKPVKKEEPVKKDNGLKILIGLLAVALLLFTASMFDSNRVSTTIMGILVLMLAVATIGKAYGYKPE